MARIMRASDAAFLFFVALGLLLEPEQCSAQVSPTNSPMRIFGAAITRLARTIQPATNDPPPTFTVTLRLLKTEGLPEAIIGQQLDVAFQAPDRLRLSANYEGQQFMVGRDG